MGLFSSKLDGFTLIELLVSISIIAMMAVLSISAYPKFSAQLSTVSEGYRVLTFLRETQSYGISSYGEVGSRFVYGLEIDSINNTMKRVIVNNNNNILEASLSPNSFKNTVFLNNKSYQTELENLFILKDNYKIVKICNDIECSNVFDTGYVVYKRPNPEARIFLLNGSLMTPSPGIEEDTSSADRLVIVIANKSNDSLSKKVVILSTGQMYIAE